MTNQPIKQENPSNPNDQKKASANEAGSENNVAAISDAKKPEDKKPEDKAAPAKSEDAADPKAAKVGTGH